MTTVLFVCTANICRSPYAHAALVARLTAASLIDVRSAGVRAEWLQTAGEPPCGEMPYDLERKSGVLVPTPAHQSTQLTLELVREADLIVAFEQAHRSAIVKMLPQAQLKTYTARQLQRLATAINEGQWPADIPPRSGDPLRDLNLARSWVAFHEDGDVDDPHGSGVEAHHACGDDIDVVVDALATLLLS